MFLPRKKLAVLLFFIDSFRIFVSYTSGFSAPVDPFFQEILLSQISHFALLPFLDQKK